MTKWYEEESRLAKDSALLSKQQLHHVVQRMEAMGIRPEAQMEAIRRYVGIAKYPQYLNADEAERFMDNTRGA